MNEKIFKKFVERKLETWKHENLKHENDTSIKKANFVITINMFITLKCIFLSHGLNDEADHQDVQGDDDVQAHVCVNVHEDPPGLIDVRDVPRGPNMESLYKPV